MAKTEGKWLIGVSCGPDSMALLHMCMQKGIPCAAAHVNYHHQKQAEEEEACIREYCSEHGIPLHVLNGPFLPSGNFEAAARTHRYEFFRQTVLEYGYRGVLIAHQEDDLLETYFMQEEKNIVPAYYGLKEEILYRGILVKRPLLHMTRKDILEYCEKNRIRYFIDETNNDDSLARNRIRHTVVEKMTRSERDLVLREIRMKNAVRQERICRVGTFVHDGRVRIGEYRKLSQEDRYELLRTVLKKAGNRSLKEIGNIDRIILEKKDFVCACGAYRLVQDEGFFFLTGKEEPYCFVCKDLQELLDLKRQAYFRIEAASRGVNTVTLSADDFPVTVRNFRDGDSIRMRFGTKSVHRFFIDRHIPRYRRGTWPVVLDGKGSVILVPGLGCDVLHFSDSPTADVIQCLLSESED
ncbi:MAG: tRNA lysidine(34) synthetase TilS [Solobacterium sp.]|nr:tRNA lysidine(34) synthetase TilS [Solobacterium sp.]